MIVPGGSLPPLGAMGAQSVRFTYVLSRELVIVHTKGELDLGWAHTVVPLVALEAAVSEIRNGLARGALGLTGAHGRMVNVLPDAP